MTTNTVVAHIYLYCLNSALLTKTAFHHLQQTKSNGRGNAGHAQMLKSTLSEVISDDRPSAERQFLYLQSIFYVPLIHTGRWFVHVYIYNSQKESKIHYHALHPGE